MKKIATSILLVIYFVVSSGFVVNLHYCMDEYYSWELGDDENESCDQCGIKTTQSSGCCRDEVKLVKIQQDLFQTKSTIYSFALPFLIAYYPLNLLLSSPVRILPNEYPQHIPPLLSKQDTYLANCVFRI